MVNNSSILRHGYLFLARTAALRSVAIRRSTDWEQHGGNILTFLFHSFWHERTAFQSVAVQAVDWYDDSEPLFCQAKPSPSSSSAGWL